MAIHAQLFERLDLEQIRNFILHGKACAKARKTYHEQEMASFTKLHTIIQDLILPEKKRSKLDDAVMDYMYISRNVQTEMAMKIGARLLFELLFEDDAKI